MWTRSWTATARCTATSTFGKQDFARGLLTSMKRGEVVGILMDTNMTPPQGAFVDFFGVPACTATGVARVALHTGAAVLPAFTIWDKQLGKYKIRFDPALQLAATGDTKPTPSPTRRSLPK